MLAEIELPNPSLELRPGMYAAVKIGIQRKADVLLVPAAALVQEKAGAFVFTLVDDKARKTPVTIGFTDGRSVEIASGLAPHQPILLAGNQPLGDGISIRRKESK